jgi:thymidylate synthase ThyX
MLWLRARDQVLEIASQMEEVGLHKQCLNRLLEPFHWITVIQTGNAAAYANFFALRCHPDAQPDIRDMACAQLRAYHASTPRQLEWGQWHLPFVNDTESSNLFPEDACRISAARCARTSYLTFDGENPDPVKDMALFEKLVSGVVHASPLEHQARPFHKTDERPMGGNLGPAWVQYRKTIPNEAATEIPAYAYEMAGIQR